MEVDCGICRVECVQIKVINLLRKDGEAAGQSVVPVHDVINAGERVDAFALDVALTLVQIVQARHVSANKTIFETLKKEEFVFLDRATDCKTRCYCTDAEDVAITKPRPRQQPGNQVTPVVAS